MMKHTGKLIAIAGAMAALASCSHVQSYSAAGDLGASTVDSLSATRTALLRIQNNYGVPVRVYTVLGHDKNYVAKSMPGEVRTWVLDPNIFPVDKISFETDPTDGTPARTLGPFRLYKGQVVDVVIPANFDMIQASVHRSVP